MHKASILNENCCTKFFWNNHFASIILHHFVHSFLTFLFLRVQQSFFFFLSVSAPYKNSSRYLLHFFKTGIRKITKNLFFFRRNFRKLVASIPTTAPTWWSNDTLTMPKNGIGTRTSTSLSRHFECSYRQSQKTENSQKSRHFVWPHHTLYIWQTPSGRGLKEILEDRCVKGMGAYLQVRWI